MKKTLLSLFESKGRSVLVLTIIFALTLNILGSFQLTDRTDALAADIVGGIYAPFYGWAHRVGQDKITVLLVDRQALDDIGTDRWPPDYQSEADFAEWAANYHPAAIFLDFYYPRARRTNSAAPALDAFSGNIRSSANSAGDVDSEGIGNLAMRLQRIRQAGTPVLIGPVGDDAALAPIAALPQVGIERRQLPRGGYPVRDSQGHLQTAFALYDLICPKVRDRCPDVAKELGDHDLAIQWGFGAGRTMPAQFVLEQCRGGNVFARVWSAVKIAFAGFVPSANRGYDKCSYSDAFSIAWLRNPPAGFDPRPLIENRVVLIGSDLNWLADFIDAPLLGSVPGVMAHAMALDNLLQSGSHAARYSHPFIGAMTYRDAMEMVLVLLGLLVIVATHEILLTRAKPGIPSRISWWLTQVAVVLCIPVLAGLLMSWVLAWPALNVITIAGLGLWELFLLAHDLWAELEKEQPRGAAPE